MDQGRPTMKWRFPWTLAALTVAAAALSAALVGHVNLIEWPVDLVARIEHDEVDEIVSVLLMVGGAFVLDQVLFTRRVKSTTSLAAERLRVVQVTMTTVQDIVNNGLNQLELLRSDAEGHVPPESLALFDEAIRDTVSRLTALGNLQAYAEKQLVVGPGVDVSMMF
jgi:hypothetical protein